MVLEIDPKRLTETEAKSWIVSFCHTFPLRERDISPNSSPETFPTLNTPSIVGVSEEV